MPRLSIRACAAVVLTLGMIATVASARRRPPPPPPPKLAVTNLAPDTGAPDGGTYVRVVGTGFLTGADGNPAPVSTKIYFGSRQGTIVRIASDTEIIAQAPGGKLGDTVDVLLIFEGRGEVKVAKAFTYVAKPAPPPPPPPPPPPTK